MYTSEILHNIDRFGTRDEPTSIITISPHPSSPLSSSPLLSLPGATKLPTGVWALLLNNARGLIKALTVDLYDIVQVCKAVSHGDLTKRVTVEVRAINIRLLHNECILTIHVIVYISSHNRSILSFKKSKKLLILWWIRYCFEYSFS